MGAVRCHLLSLAALAAAAASSWPAGAQCRLCASPQTERPAEGQADSLQLEVETSLSFDRLILFGEGEGSALIRPDGSRSAEGAVSNIGPRAKVGTVVVRGTPNRAVRVELPRRVELHSLGGGRIIVEELASDLPALPRLDAAGRLSFRIGGRVRLSGDSAGDYRGDLPVTVDYQ